MSEPLRVAFVAEGPTDLILLETFVKHLLDGRDVVPTRFQPRVSEAFVQVSGELGE